MTNLLWQLYDEQRHPIMTGGAPKLKVAMEGLLHGSAHLWIWRHGADGIELLVQKRSATKINWPGRFDKSAGGHITYGEDPIETIVRKAADEIGFTIVPSQISFVDVHRWQAPIDEVDMRENEFQWIYLSEQPDPVVNVPTDEVESVVWKPLKAVIDEAQHFEGLYVPYGETYFRLLCIASALATKSV